MYLFKGDRDGGFEVVAVPFKVGVLDLHQFEYYVAGSPLHSLVPHVGVPEVGVAGSTFFDFEGELLHTRDDFLRVAEVAFAANHLALALAAGTRLGVEVVVPSSQLDPPGHSPLAAALPTLDHVIGVLSPSALAVGTSHLLFNQDVKLFAQVEVFEFQEDLDL